MVGLMLDLRLLRFFIAIYEEKNITAAAERCHVSQPSLSAGLCAACDEGGQGDASVSGALPVGRMPMAG